MESLWPMLLIIASLVAGICAPAWADEPETGHSFCALVFAISMAAFIATVGQTVNPTDPEPIPAAVTLLKQNGYEVRKAVER